MCPVLPCVSCLGREEERELGEKGPARETPGREHMEEGRGTGDRTLWNQDPWFSVYQSPVATN